MRLLAFVTLLVCACSPHTPDWGPFISRHEILKIAESYEQLTWTPQKKHRLHGEDRQGVWVDTPDTASGFPQSNFWWTPNTPAVGMPYKWGGFDTPESFLKRINNDKVCYAGDISSEMKRRENNDAISHEAAGIDCSGFVSRCWQLPRPYSTYEMEDITQNLSSFDELKLGDALNIPRNHIVLFLYWATPDHSEFIGTESGPNPSWKVARKRFSLKNMIDLGYKPIRYLRIVENE